MRLIFIGSRADKELADSLKDKPGLRTRIPVWSDIAQGPYLFTQKRSKIAALSKSGHSLKLLK